jgi:hypothetical protein
MKKTLIVGLLFFRLFSSVNAQEVAGDAALPPGWWLLPKTNIQFKIGGYVKLDLIHDFNPINSPDFFDVSKIPTDGSEGVSTHLNVKETRLDVDVKSPTKIGEIRTYVEGDFYGTGGVFRLRHAFLEINNRWLVGQWWSNFMDESIIPNTLDFEKPAAYAFARHPMIRYKHSFSSDMYLAIAVEEPSTNAQTPEEPGKFESPIPDFTLRFRLTKPWGHIQLSSFIGKLVYREAAGNTDEIILYGGNLSGQFNFMQQKDKLFYQVVFGPGVGRFRGGLSAGLDAKGELQALDDAGFTVGLEHRWNSAFSSVFVYNLGRVDNSGGQPFSAIRTTDYLAANVLWHFTERAFAGVEYLWGLRQDLDNQDGTANRVQLSVKYTFN